MYREFHEVPFNSKIKEAIIGPFSWSQLLWLAPACYLSYQMKMHVPKIPTDYVLFSNIHYFLPIIVALIFTLFKHPKTNLTLSQYLIVQIKFRLRQRTFTYRRQRMPRLNRDNRKGD